MSVVEDVRGVVQDLVAPDLKAVQARLDSAGQRLDMLEKQMDRLHQQQSKFEGHMEKRFDEVMGGIQMLIRFNTLEQRLAALESRQPSQ